MKKNGFQLQDFTVENLLNLMEIYLNEWSYRCDLLWNQAFKYYYATLIVLFLPNISSFLGIDLYQFPSLSFRVISLILSLLYLYVSWGYSLRLEASGKTYQRIINMLPDELQRITISNSKFLLKYPLLKTIFSGRTSYIKCFLMFLSLFVMSIIMIIYDLNK